MSALLVTLVTVAVYLAVIAGIWRALGVRYDELSRTRAMAVRGIVVPFTVGSALLVVVTSLLGWWSPVLFEPSRSGPTWTLVVPVLMAGTALAGLLTVEWSSPQLRRILRPSRSAASSWASRRSSRPAVSWSSVHGSPDSRRSRSR